MPRVELIALYPQREDEDAITWTDRMLSQAGKHGTNRQCSIGWHGECSDPTGSDCHCICHDKKASVYTVEGHAEDGQNEVTRLEIGQHSWPPTPGEPATTWAEWIWAYSDEDAKNRVIAKRKLVA